MEANNMKDMRDEVSALLAWAESNLRLSPDLLKEGTRECCELIVACCKSALAEQPRNCDVGTALEQSKRFMDFCRPGCRPPNCEECKVYPKRMNKFWCQLEWAQMPYEGGADQ